MLNGTRSQGRHLGHFNPWHCPNPWRRKTHTFGPAVARNPAMHIDYLAQCENSPATSLVIKSTNNLQRMSTKFRWALVFLVWNALLRGTAAAQSDAYSNSLPEAPQVQIERSLGFFPVVRAPGIHDPYAPLSARQKFQAFARTTFDPSAVVVAALGAGVTQPGNSQPQYGDGSQAFGQRVGAIAAGYGTATFFTEDLLPLSVRMFAQQRRTNQSSESIETLTRRLADQAG